MKQLQTVVAVVCFLFMIFPLYWLFSSSLKTEASVFARPPEIFPMHPTLDAYITQLNQVTFDILGSFKNIGNTGSIWPGQIQNQGKESDCIPVPGIPDASPDFHFDTKLYYI